MTAEELNWLATGAPVATNWLLFEHDDGRYRACGDGEQTFTDGTVRRRSRAHATVPRLERVDPLDLDALKAAGLHLESHSQALLLQHRRRERAALDAEVLVRAIRDGVGPT